VRGGFEETDEPIISGVLVVLYPENLKVIQDKIIKNGGKVIKPIFEFLGEKRLHFIDTSGNELAIWLK
jgi:hypothetical protein